MPRIKRSKQAHSNHEKIHKKSIDGYSVGEHVVIVGQGGSQNLYVVKIVDLWEAIAQDRPQANVSKVSSCIDGPKFTAKYYYNLSDLPPEYVKRLPQECLENEIYLSNFTADNSLEAIVSKCNVSLEPSPNTPAMSNYYICRYQFFPWNVSNPFSALLTASSEELHEDDGKRPIGHQFQATVNHQMLHRPKDSAKLDQSTRIWSPCSSPDIAVQTFLILCRYFQYSAGSVVYAWHPDINEEVTCTVLDHFSDGNFRLQFGDRSGEDLIHCRYVRGVLQEDECLEVLQQENFQYPSAIVKIIGIVQQKSEEAKLQLQNSLLSKNLKVLGDCGSSKSRSSKRRSSGRND